MQPDWRPPLHADTVYRWHTTTAGHVRVAAASAGGSPVWFEVVPDDELPRHIAAVSRGVAERAFWGSIVTVYALVLAGARVLARRNVRLGRSDQRGGLRLAAFVFALGMLSWAFGGPHTATLEELRIVALAVAGALFGSACLLVGYLALEPIIRRRWPDRLISWSRVLAGDWRDPMVGRDALVGTGLGLVMAAAQLGGVWIAFHSGGKQGIKMIDPETLEGIRGLAAAVVNIVVPPIAVSLSVLVFIVVISILVRRIGVATAAFAVLLTMVVSLQETLSVTQVAVAAVGAACFTLAIARVGLLAGVVAHLVFFLVDRFPLTLDVSVWYLPAALTPPLLIAALATFGAVTAVGGGRVFERLLPE